jgi:hypothetical protein
MNLFKLPFHPRVNQGTNSQFPQFPRNSRRLGTVIWDEENKKTTYIYAYIYILSSLSSSIPVLFRPALFPFFWVAHFSLDIS